MFSKPDSSSIERSLTIGMGLLMFAVLLVLLTIASWLGRESAIQFALSRLQHDAEAIVASMDLEQRKIKQSLPPVYRQPLSGHYYTVLFDDGFQILSRSLWDQELVSAVQRPGEAHYWLAAGPQRQHLLVWHNTYESGGHRFSIAVAEDIAPLLSAIKRFLAIGVAASMAAVLLMLVVQRYVIRRILGRLDSIRDDVRAVNEGKRVRLDESVPVEVRPMVVEFNQLLKAWKQHQERSRNAVGNLAHALKGPLGIIYRLAHKHEIPELEVQAERIQGLLECELRRARITGRAAVGSHFVPRDDMENLVATIEMLHQEKSIQIVLLVDAPPSLPLDQSDMLELIGNLLDNAAKWARQKIRLVLKAGDELQLVLEDDGPGIPAQLRSKLLARGRKLDENQPGHGLGLAIAQDIAALYDGQFQLGRSKRLGGLQVNVMLPLAVVER